MNKIVKREVISSGTVRNFNRYFQNYSLARAFAKEKGTKIIRVDDKAKGKYLVSYTSVI